MGDEYHRHAPPGGQTVYYDYHPGNYPPPHAEWNARPGQYPADQPPAGWFGEGGGQQATFAPPAGPQFWDGAGVNYGCPPAFALQQTGQYSQTGQHPQTGQYVAPPPSLLQPGAGYNPRGRGRGRGGRQYHPGETGRGSGAAQFGGGRGARHRGGGQWKGAAAARGAPSGGQSWRTGDEPTRPALARQNGSTTGHERRGRGRHEGAGLSERGRGQRGRGERARKTDGGDVENDESQRGRLIEQLWSGTYECMVCCEVVGNRSSIWSCSQCSHIYHLHCIKMWARSPAATNDGDEKGWRCPACQQVTQNFPYECRCFCGRVRNPEWNRQDTPHSCGELCRRRRGNDCVHPCNILCHPGPCPPCETSISISCSCGKTKQTVKCRQSADVKCRQTCERTLNCGRHQCQLTCHADACQPCDVVYQQKCFCEQEERPLTCGEAASFSSSYSCEKPCSRPLECGEHSCARLCHAGPCAACPLMPSSGDRCHCGQSLVSDLTAVARASCLDEIPTCGGVCGKALACGDVDAPHRCRWPCHRGACGTCDGVTVVTCRCRAHSERLPCGEAVKFTASEPFKCDKRCSKKLECRRHRCKQACCVDTDHECSLVCGQPLSCGLHRCDEACHRGNCATCWHVGFDELHCHCGAEVLYPPVACGTRPPECAKTCTRPQSCDHPVSHGCHSEPTCPPCTRLVRKWCLGRHEERSNVACHLGAMSCGMPCDRLLACGQHRCQLTCHKGACLRDGQPCVQPCQQARPECGHPCGQPCHGDEPCPPSSCKTLVTLRCACGNRQSSERCTHAADSKRIMASMLALKVKDAEVDGSIDLAEIADLQNHKNTKKQLDCNEDCARHERNRRMALALQIHNPDLSTRVTQPPYPQTMKDFARANVTFVTGIEQALFSLVQTAQQSKQPKRSHAFAAMSYEKRHLVHNLAEFYGCETQSYDDEPRKNVVATAHRNKCWQPTVTLSSLVSKGGKAPPPIAHGNTITLRNFSSTSLKNGQAGGAAEAAAAPTVAPPGDGAGASWAARLK